jgi:hypothetical protein
MKSAVDTANNGSFRTHKAHSPEEIIAAGGATAFSRKSDKNNQKLIDSLNESPAIEPFTSKEWNDLSSQLDQDK